MGSFDLSFMPRSRLTPQAYRRITLTSVLALGFIIVTGGMVRVTGSGLGCPDWPMCDNDRIVAPAEYHAMIEFVNRTVTGFVSVAVIVAVLGSLLRVPRRRDLLLLSLGLVLGVIGQIVLGGLTVLFELKPQFVMAHFLLSLVLLTNSLVLHHRAAETGSGGRISGTDRVLVVGRPMLWTTRLLAGATAAAVFLGTVVTASGPHGGDPDVERLSFTVRDATMVHSVVVWVVVALAVVVFAGSSPAGLLRRRALQMLAVLIAQGALGYTQYFLKLPAALVGLHILGATLVWTAMVRLWLSLHRAPMLPADRNAGLGPRIVVAA